MADRFFSVMSIDDRGVQESKLLYFQLVLLLTTAIQQVNYGWEYVVILLGCALLGIKADYARPAAFVALLVLLSRHVSTFPVIANHTYLEAILLAFLCWIDRTEEEQRELFFQATRWLVVILFFYSGVQKAWYGEYFDGRFLAFLASQSPKTRTAFELLLPQAEFARLLSYRMQPGNGPFVVDSLFFKILSNGAWISEIAVALLLAFRRTRVLGIIFGVAMMFAIEFIARELIFGILVLSLLFLFATRDINRRLLPVYICALIYMSAGVLGMVPHFYWQ
jgi:hypothetical protein